MEFNINSVWIIIGACMLMILVSVISQMRNDLKHMRITLEIRLLKSLEQLKL